MTYNQAIHYCLKKIVLSKMPQKVYNRFKATKAKYKKGTAGVEAIQSMFNYFGIRDHSRYLVDDEEMTLKQALRICFNSVSQSTMTYKDYNRLNASRKRFKRGELEIEGITALFEYYGVERLDNFKRPTRAKQKEYNDFVRPTGKKLDKEYMKRYSIEDKDGVRYYGSLAGLCKSEGFDYRLMYRELNNQS